MEKLNRVAVAGIVLAAFLLNPVLLASGNPIPGRWEKVAQTKPGAKITVFTKIGARQELRYQSFDNGFLVCTDRSKKSVQIEKVAIDKVILNVKGRNVKRGLIFGILGGAVIAGCILSQTATDYAYGTVPTYAAYGAGAGMIFGTIANSEETIYVSREAALAK